jgi:uncharacterized membrane protein (UPF0127 family)
VQLVHDPADGDERVLATNVETADSLLSQARGLMFRRSIPDDYALAFQFDSVEKRDVHMLFVPFPIDVVWTVESEVGRVERLRPWLGFARARGDEIIELPAGAADDVNPGDSLHFDA